MLETAQAAGKLTLMGPATGISAAPGLPWAPFNLVADDLEAMCERLKEVSAAVGPVDGDERTCLWFTADDPDGSTLLIVDR